MAKLQRFRRRGRVGEGDSPVEVDEVESPDIATADESTPDEVDDVDGGDADADEAEADVPDDDAAADPDDGAAEDDEELEDDEPPAAKPTRYRGGVGRFSLREWTPLTILQAAHPKQAIVTALAVSGVAVLTGRPAREALIVFATVLVGQAILGIHNDLVDWRRDQAHEATGKPIADGRLSTADAWTALIIAGFLLIPLAITTGITAGLYYMASVAVAMLGNVLFRTTPLSVWSWAVSFGLLPFYLSYGGWGGQAVGNPPETAIVVLFGLLGIGVHFLRAVWGLVADHEDEWTYLPLKLGLKLGATRLLVLAVLFIAAIPVALAVVGGQVGLSR